MLDMLDMKYVVTRHRAQHTYVKGWKGWKGEMVKEGRGRARSSIDFNGQLPYAHTYNNRGDGMAAGLCFFSSYQIRLTKKNSKKKSKKGTQASF